MTVSPSYPRDAAPGWEARDSASFRLAMRQLASGVSIVTNGSGEGRNGFTATSISSLSADPPTLIVCVNRSASFYAQLSAGDLFGVSVLGEAHTEIADRFAGRSDAKGAERFRAGRWIATPDGVPLLADALAAFECEAEEIIERHSHAILVGRVRLARPRAGGGALLYWRGGYDRIGWSADEISRAVGLAPAQPGGDVVPFQK
jgi:flavin reductase (DIM6/NTAB) family NADH-FMN oxidoreductase RutF